MREKLAVEQELLNAQTKIGQTEKMASLGRLAAGVAHEINNPLTSILLYGNMMREKLDRENPLSKNLDYVLEDAERCRDIVKNLLAYSRQSNTSKEVFPLDRLVTDSLRLLRDQRLFMHVEVVKELASHEVLVRADLNQICQVVINLIINGIDAMKETGKLTLKTSWVVDTEKAYLEVSDSGSGIPEENISSIFDPFFTTKELGKGTGLGLSMPTNRTTTAVAVVVVFCSQGLLMPGGITAKLNTSRLCPPVQTTALQVAITAMPKSMIWATITVQPMAQCIYGHCSISH